MYIRSNVIVLGIVPHNRCVNLTIAAAVIGCYPKPLDVRRSQVTHEALGSIHGMSHLLAGQPDMRKL